MWSTKRIIITKSYSKWSALANAHRGFWTRWRAATVPRALWTSRRDRDRWAADARAEWLRGSGARRSSCTASRTPRSPSHENSEQCSLRRLWREFTFMCMWRHVPRSCGRRRFCRAAPSWRARRRPRPGTWRSRSPARSRRAHASRCTPHTRILCLVSSAASCRSTSTWARGILLVTSLQLNFLCFLAQFPRFNIFHFLKAKQKICH